MRADDEIRTRDPHLGKVMRYQLRYIRVPTAAPSMRPPTKQNFSRYAHRGATGYPEHVG